MTIEGREPAWKTYFKSGLFLAPAVLAWGFVAVFVVPKLKQIWRDADLIDHRISEFQWMIQGLSFAMERMGLILLLAVAVVIALEFSGDVWRRYRKSALGGVVFLFNTAIIVALVGACLVAAIAAPALIKPQ